MDAFEYKVISKLTGLSEIVDTLVEESNIQKETIKELKTEVLMLRAEINRLHVKHEPYDHGWYKQPHPNSVPFSPQPWPYTITCKTKE